jgi:hypothetical protein
MAFGRNKARKGWEMRAFPLGIGKLSATKLASILALRAQVLDLMRNMASACFTQEPLAGTLASNDLNQRLLEVQRAKAGLNSVWRESARLRVKPALEEADDRYFRKLVGRLRHVDQEIIYHESRGDRPCFINIPQEIETAVTATEIEGLKQLASSGKAVAAFRAVALEGSRSGLTGNQVAILLHIHACVQKGHRPPEFGAKDEFFLQLHIDSRMLPTGQSTEAMALRTGVSFLLEDDQNKRYCRFLDISGAEPRSERIRIPLTLTPEIAKRLETTETGWASLILEISSRSVGVRLVAGKPKPEQPTVAERFVGRDFGYTNTICLSVLEAPAAVNLEEIRSSLEVLDTKEQSQKHLEGHRLPEGTIVLERHRFSGRPFMERIKVLCEGIDGYKSRIDLDYNTLDALKAELVKELGLEPGDMILPENKKASAKVCAFFQLLGRINDLKAARRVCYRKVASIKKCWFGYLSTQEVELAKKHGAAVVREDLTVEAIEKDSPSYKGRAFNKMLNNGSKGKYQRRAASKLLWNGIPEVVAPSWYTSRVCLKHSVIVAKQHRKGESIYLPCCGHHDHADEHAADTIAGLAFLVPKINGVPPSGPVCDTSTPAISVGSPVL